MAGYCGYSMSNNAVWAYENGEKPFSKWTKSDILEEASRQGFDISKAKKLTVSECRSLFLRWTAYHHTSNYFNRTDFYMVDSDSVTDEQINAVIASRSDRVQADKPKPIKARVRYGEWEGTRKHPKLKEYETLAVIVGNWAYTETGKKRTDGKHFQILETYAKAPKGTADIFKRITKSI